MIIGNVLKEPGLEAEYEPPIPMKGTSTSSEPH